MAAFSLTELLFVLGLAATLGGVATAHLRQGVDEARAAGAARYLAARFHEIRMQAVMRGAATAVRFVSADGSYRITSYVDGNGDGVLTRDIQDGVDVATAAPERLPDRFAGVDFGALPGLPAADAGSGPPGSDPVRFGASDGVTFSPLGTSSSGSVYVLGAGNRQFAVRVYGESGRTRVLRFDTVSWSWTPIAFP